MKELTLLLNARRSADIKKGYRIALLEEDDETVGQTLKLVTDTVPAGASESLLIHN